MHEDLIRNTPKLGFGFMRLPRLAGSEAYDTAQIDRMVDAFMAAGLTYFDTAYVYDNGNSERAMKAALVDRYPRDRFTVATKLNVGIPQCTDAEFARGELTTSLERLGCGYLDYYLLHAVQKGNYEKFERFGLWDFLKEQKAQGRIRHYGFSFHDTPELLDQILTAHPDVDFVQLQINYADWEALNVQSRGVYETARRHGKPVVIMEPVKGGMLANPPEAIREAFHAADPEASCASWAIRFAASLEGVLTVLSGMTTLEQVKDNVSYMNRKDFHPLDAREQEVVLRARQILEAQDSIACTGCRYCVDGCPMSINIPDIFRACNRESIFGDAAAAERGYAAAVKGRGKASDCVHCLQCEAACPQHLTITAYLEQAAARFDIA